MKRIKLKRKPVYILLGTLLFVILMAGSNFKFTTAPNNSKVNMAQHVNKKAVGATAAPKSDVASGWRLIIPNINVNAPIQPLGLTAQGNLQAPGNVTGVGWYKLGSTPGQNGTAVIDGHDIGLKGQPGVFANLGKLRKNDIVSVVIDQVDYQYQVQDSQVYDADSHPQEVFTSSDNLAHLNLITCDGKWNSAKKMYTNRLVVFATKIKPAAT